MWWFFITAWILPSMTGAISATLFNSMRYSRGRCNIWNIGRSDGVKNSINISGYQWSRLQLSHCSGRKNRPGEAILPEGASSGQLFSQEEKRSREQLDGALQRGVRTAYLVIRRREVLIRRNMCPDLSVDQKLTTTTTILLYPLLTWTTKGVLSAHGFINSNISSIAHKRYN